MKFQVVHGDVLTRDFTSSDKIVAAVWNQVKAFMGEIYKKSDICRIEILKKNLAMLVLHIRKK